MRYIMFQKNCPKCDNIINYNSVSALNRSVKNNSICKICYKNKNKSINPDNKICTKCKTEKSRNMFWKDASMPDSLKYHCVECMLNDDKRKESKRLSAKKNKKHIQKYKQTYYKTNKNIIYKKNRQYVEKNKEKILSYLKEYRSSHKEKISEQKQKWAKNHPEAERKKSRKRRASKQQLNENYTAEHEAITRKAFNNKCFNCGSKDKLHIDHHYPLSKGHPLTLKNAVVLCKSCNSSKGNKHPKDFYSKSKLNKLEKILNKIS